MIAIRLDFNSVDADGNVIGLLRNVESARGTFAGDSILAYDAEGNACEARVVDIDDEQIVRLRLVSGTWHERGRQSVDYGNAGWHAGDTKAYRVSKDSHSLQPA